MIGRGLPLQPSLAPWSPVARRALALIAAAAAVLALGLVAPARAAPDRVVITGPGHALDYARAARRMIDAAQTRIRVVQFVIRPDDGPVCDLLEALAAAAKRGVDVRVGLDYGTLFESTDIDPKHEAPAQWLRDHGVAVVLDELDRTTHAKALIVDRRFVLIGSHNWTMSALSRNREASVELDDPLIAAELERDLVGSIPGLP